MAQVQSRQQAHELIDRISSVQVAAVVNLLEAMLDPVSVALANAPFEDEEISEEEEQAVARAKAEGYPSSPDSHEELLKDLGLTLEDWERMRSEPLETEGLDR